MGTNPGPDLANLYLYAYESTFVDKLVKIHGLSAAKFLDIPFGLSTMFSLLTTVSRFSLWRGQTLLTLFLVVCIREF